MSDPPNSIKLDTVLLVHDLKKNLLSIGQLTTNYPINCEFFYVGFTIKYRNTNRRLLTGHKRGNLYNLPTSSEAHFLVHFQAVD